MTSIGIFQIALFFAIILVCTKPLGALHGEGVRGRADVSASGSALA